MLSSSRIRNIKWLGVLAAVCSSIAAIAAGDVIGGVGIIGAALGSAGILQAPPSIPPAPLMHE